MTKKTNRMNFKQIVKQVVQVYKYVRNQMNKTVKAKDKPRKRETKRNVHILKKEQISQKQSTDHRQHPNISQTLTRTTT